MKHILVPTDFSKSSQNAARYAIALAKRFNAEVTLANVVPPSVIVDDSVLAFAMTTQAEIIEGHKKLMKKDTDRLSKVYPKITGLVKEGAIFDVIYNLSQLHDSDLIVMGMKGKGKSNSIFGSTTIAFIRKFSIPVFVIPEEAGFNLINDVVLASDLDENIDAERYGILLRISAKFNARIHILNVQKKSDAMNPLQATGTMETEKMLSGQKYISHSIKGKTVKDGIQKFIRENPADILVMLARRHNFLERVFGKINTTVMSYQIKIPLLVLHE